MFNRAGFFLTTVLNLPFVLAEQPSAPKPISAPLRELEWGQLNFLHTTDSHGWLAGHLQEPSYSADWGDYISFTTRMRETAEAQGQDLLVIDTGDRVEGNGLYDSSKPRGVFISEILRQQHIDLICSGNHELYKQDTSEAEYLTTVPNFRDHYLASNIDIVDSETREFVPLALRYKKFTTKNQGIRLAAFGFLFDFTSNFNNTIVQPVEQTITEPWFQEVIQDENVDLFVVVGHVALRSKEYDAVFRAIRSVRKNTPIQFFGGHAHIRDYVRYDDAASGLASGRFMETIGFVSIDGLSPNMSDSSPAERNPTFRHKYIDNNLYSFYHHTRRDEETFATEHGRNVSRLIHSSRMALNLDAVHGCAPRDLWLNRVPYPSDDNLYTWLGTQVLLDSVRDGSRKFQSALVVVNTGAIRFDILKGPFTQDSVFIVSPFTSGFRYVKDVPRDKAQLVVHLLNKQEEISMHAARSIYHNSDLACPEQHAGRKDRVVDEPSMWDSAVAPGQMALAHTDQEADRLIPGYTTIDDAGVDGDDTIHSPIPFYSAPNCIQTLVPSNVTAVADTVDLVYIDFIEPYVTLAAKSAGLDVDFTTDSDVYMPGKTLTDLILNWVKENWRCP